jgi:hypothetical protein
MPETLNGNFEFVRTGIFTNYWIIKSDSLGNVQRLSTGSYNNMKTEYMEHNYTRLDGYYIVEAESKFLRVVK